MNKNILAILLLNEAVVLRVIESFYGPPRASDDAG